MAQDCVFCRIGSGDISSEVLHRDEDCFVIRDVAPKAPVHLLLIPNQHFTYLADLTPEHYTMLGGMFKAAEQMARREGVAETGYRLIINQGSNAGQQVAHLHLHMLAGRPLGSMG